MPRRGPASDTWVETGRSHGRRRAGSLIVDYILNAAVGVSAGIEAITSAFPGLTAPASGCAWRR